MKKSFNLNRSQVYLAKLFMKKFIREHKLSESNCNSIFYDGGITITSLVERCDEFIVYSNDYSWKTVEEMCFKYISPISQRGFVFSNVSRSEESPVTFINNQTALELSERQLFELQSIRTLGPGTLITDDGKHMFKTGSDGRIKIQLIDKQSLPDTVDYLLHRYLPKHCDEVLYLETLVNSDLNFKIARYFGDYRLSRSKCYLIDGEVPNVPWVLKFELKEEGGCRTIQHELSCSTIKELMVELYGNGIWPDIETAVEQHNHLVKLTLGKL